MNTFIHKGLRSLLVAGFVVTAACNAQTTSRACNNWLIAGVYGFTIEGTKLAGSPAGPQVGVAMTDFNGKTDIDGKGSLVQIDAVSINGVQVSDFTHKPATGTYQVNPDCTGTFTINFTDGRPTVTTYFVVVDNGDEIDTMVVGVPLIVPGLPPATQGPSPRGASARGGSDLSPNEGGACSVNAFPSLRPTAGGKDGHHRVMV